MPLRWVAGWFAVAFSVAAAAVPPIPDTPAGRALGAFLDAYNSGDGARLQTFVTTYKLDPGTGILHFRAQTGGFDLLAIEKSEKTRIAFRVKEKNSPTEAIGKIDVNNAEPPTIANFSLYATPPGAKFEEVVLDAAARARVIDGVQCFLDEYYVFPDVAKKMITAVRAKQKRGGYDTVDDGDVFAKRLTDDLRAVSPDKHLGVDFNPLPQPESKTESNKPSANDDTRFFKRSNCGFEKVEHLPPNIGYLKFNGFAPPDICGPTAVAAMNFLADSDALIVDLRDNHGGVPAMVAMISTYLFDKPTHLNDIYNRKENTTEQFWTLPYVPGKRLAHQPVFVLTSKNTFSGAEEFSYNLKNLKRATLIGETTGGGAHPVSPHRIDDHFSIDVPFARAINPITKTNWEGIGVEPDVKADAADALAEAVRRAQAQLQAKPAASQ